MIDRLFFILTLFIFSNSINAQSWEFTTGSNAFDGNYRSASVIGKGIDFPYNKPILVINLFNEESLNFYIGNAGYFQDVNDLQVLWNFDIETDIIYESIGLSISKDGKTIFLKSFINSSNFEHLSQLEFIEKLKSANKVFIRIKNRYGKNDLTFKLYGSSKAIKSVLTNSFLKKEIEKQRALEKLAHEEIEKEVKSISNILTLLYNEGITDEFENTAVFEMIELYCDVDDIKLYNIDSLIIKNKKSRYSIHLFNKDRNLLKEIPISTIDIQKFISKKEEQEFNEGSKLIYPQLSIFPLSEIEKEKLCREIISKPPNYNTDYEISKIDSISIEPSFLQESISVTIFNQNREKIGGLLVFLEEYLNTMFKQYKEEGIKKIESLIAPYNFSQSEKKLIFIQFNDYDLVNIIDKKVFEIEFDVDSKSSIDIEFKNKNGMVKWVKIIDKDIVKSFKKKIRRYHEKS